MAQNYLDFYFKGKETELTTLTEGNERVVDEGRYEISISVCSTDVNAALSKRNFEKGVSHNLEDQSKDKFFEMKGSQLFFSNKLIKR